MSHLTQDRPQAALPAALAAAANGPMLTLTHRAMTPTCEYGPIFPTPKLYSYFRVCPLKDGYMPWGLFPGMTTIRDPGGEMPVLLLLQWIERALSRPLESGSISSSSIVSDAQNRSTHKTEAHEVCAEAMSCMI